MGLSLQSFPKSWLKKPTLDRQPPHHLPHPLNSPFATGSLHGAEELMMTPQLTALLGERDLLVPAVLSWHWLLGGFCGQPACPDK